MSATAGEFTAGKKLAIQVTATYRTAKALMGIAALPSEKRDGGRGSLRRRLRRMLETGELVGRKRIALVARIAPIHIDPEKRERETVLTRIWIEDRRTIAHPSKVQ
jgi:hypothetical protein